jgi:hypothetical protein
MFPYVKNRLKGRWLSNDEDLLKASVPRSLRKRGTFGSTTGFEA